MKRIWAGTDDGLIQTTSDGGLHWTDVTPPDLRSHPWSKISIMDAGHFDAQTAYAAVNTMRLDDSRPHIYRTHDGGKTWTHITNGIDSDAIINVVREDPKRKGLLFAGSEDQVWVSFDDGDHWSSLRLNMPATSIRDLIVKDDDIAVGTHGRSFYILDDIAALRQISGSTAGTGRCSPASAYRSVEQVSGHADSAGRAVRVGNKPDGDLAATTWAPDEQRRDAGDRAEGRPLALPRVAIPDSARDFQQHAALLIRQTQVLSPHEGFMLRVDTRRAARGPSAPGSYQARRRRRTARTEDVGSAGNTGTAGHRRHVGTRSCSRFA